MTVEVMQPMDAKSDQFVSRVANWPLMVSAIGQVNNVYNNVKERNTVLKATLETAESSVKTVAGCAAPVVGKLDKPSKFIQCL